MSSQFEEDPNRSHRPNDSDSDVPDKDELELLLGSEDEDDEYEDAEEEDNDDNDVEHKGDEERHEEPERAMNHQEKLAAIARLVASIKDLSEAEDHEKSQAVKRIRIGFYPESAYQHAAAKILRRATEAQLRGHLVAKHHGRRGKQFMSLSDRLDRVNNTLKKSKASCKMALDPSNIDKLVDDPDKEYNQKNANRRLNEQRNIEVKMGKAELDKQKKLSGEGGDDERKSGTPAKKKKTPAKATPAKSTPSKTPQKPSSNVTPAKRRMSTIKKEKSSNRRVQAPDFNHESPTKKSKENPGSSLMMMSRDDNHETMSTLSGSYAMHPPAPSTDGPAAPMQQADFRYDDDVPYNQLEERYRGLSNAELEQLVMERAATRSQDAELQRRYREIICSLLGVNHHYVNALTLGELRLYARGYYHPLSTIIWFHREMPEQFETGYQAFVWDSTGHHSEHIAQAFPTLLPLAIERGDIGYAPDGSLISTLPNWLPHVTPQQARALGVDDNPWEVHPFLGRNAQDPRATRQS